MRTIPSQGPLTRYNRGVTAPFPAGFAHAPPPLPVALPEYPSRELKRGQVLYRAGDEGEAIFLVEEGLLKLSVDLASGKERITAIAGPGDLVGAITRAVHPCYQDSAEALSPRVRVTIIPSDRLDDAGLQQAVLAAAGRYLARLKEALEDAELPVGARLARAFLRLGERFGQSSEGRVRLTLPLTHENFAALVGAARETTTAVLSNMRQEGLLQGTRGSYSFNPHDLSAFALSAAC